MRDQGGFWNDVNARREDIYSARQGGTQRILPTPTSNDVFAGAQMLGEGAGALTTGDFSQMSGFGEAKANQAQIDAQMQENHPMANLAGELTGSAATLVTGKAPFSKPLARGREAQIATKEIKNALNAASRYSSAKPGVQRYLSGVWDNLVKKGVTPAMGRAAETGLEGAIISTLEGGDPMETAAYSAGSQLAGSTILSLMPTNEKNALRFAGAIAGMWALARFGQEFAPGENDLFDAADFSFEKAKYMLLAGTLSGIAGAGRIRGEFGNNFPVFAEAMTQIPRGAAVSMINRVTQEKEEGDDTTETVLRKLSTNPDYFGENVRNRLDRAIRNDNFGEELDKLMQNDSFVEKLNEAE
jgi:hypothetical protein